MYLYQIPSSLSNITYSLIFLQTMTFSYHTHLVLGIAFKKNQSKPLPVTYYQDESRFYKCTYVTVLVVMALYIIVQTVMLVLALFI